MTIDHSAIMRQPTLRSPKEKRDGKKVDSFGAIRCLIRRGAGGIAIDISHVSSISSCSDGGGRRNRIQCWLLVQDPLFAKVFNSFKHEQVFFVLFDFNHLLGYRSFSLIQMHGWDIEWKEN